jgi:tRNA(fMet)-specific endonuclease VapC
LKYVLDTNVFSAVMAGSAVVEARLQELHVRDVLVPQPVLAEIAAGIERLPRSKRERLLRQVFARVCSQFARSAWTDEVSHAYGRIKAHMFSRGTAIEDFDLAIAAHALVEGATVATANVRHFERVPGLQVENWLRGH